MISGPRKWLTVFWLGAVAGCLPSGESKKPNLEESPARPADPANKESASPAAGDSIPAYQPFLGDKVWRYADLPGLSKGEVESEIYSYDSPQPKVFAGGVLPCQGVFAESEVALSARKSLIFQGEASDLSCVSDVIPEVDTATSELQVELYCTELQERKGVTVGQLAALRSSCGEGFQIHYNFRSSFQSKTVEEGSGNLIAGKGRLLIALQQEDGSPCAWKRGGGGVFLQNSPCQYVRYVAYDEYSIAGRPIPGPSRRLLLSARALNGALDGKYFAAGIVAVAFNNWTGEINFDRGQPDPEIVLRAASEGTFQANYIAP